VVGGGGAVVVVVEVVVVVVDVVVAGSVVVGAAVVVGASVELEEGATVDVVGVVVWLAVSREESSCESCELLLQAVAVSAKTVAIAARNADSRVERSAASGIRRRHAAQRFKTSQRTAAEL